MYGRMGGGKGPFLTKVYICGDDKIDMIIIIDIEINIDIDSSSSSNTRPLIVSYKTRPNRGICYPEKSLPGLRIDYLHIHIHT
jgi:hypothetical protein